GEIMTILVVEDESQLNKMIRDYLETLGWAAISAESGPEALDLFRSESPDFILLDVMMPGLDGLDVMRRIRETSTVPVIFITAMAEESDKLIGLELGADDYITKPFSLKEMAARIRTVMRRVMGPEETVESPAVLIVRDIEIDPERRSVRRSGVLLDLTAVQFDILHGFMRHPGRVFSRTEILEFFQDHAWEGYERTIDVHIKNIRKALEPDRDNPIYLETVRGVGYRLSDTVS
ncbi:MAG: response regulator transcription factor, partial [Spirochaetaceae bacterium]|nr:response regulator transcription factor [Spirochaetaceae bacterium]